MTEKFNAQSTADEVVSGVSLAGKRIFITGISSGIGRETARSLASHGADVVGAVTDLAKAGSATASIRDAANEGRRRSRTDRAGSGVLAERIPNGSRNAL